MNDLSFEFNSPMKKEDWDKLQDNEMEDTEEVIFKTPSGKRVPFRKVKHGEWISSYRTWEFTFECSVCGKEAYEESNFCPSCGADMRGEQNDSN